MSETSDGIVRVEVNRHTVIIEPGRIFQLILRGMFHGDESTQVHTLIYDHSDRVGQLAFVGDLSEATGIDPAARRVWVHVPRPLPFEITYLCGGSFAMRTLAMTVYRAAVFLHPKAFGFPVELVPDRAAVPARLAAFRASKSATT